MQGLARRALLSIMALAGLIVAAAAQDGMVVSRRVGVLAYRGDEAALTRWQPTFDALGKAVDGVRFEVLPLSLDGVRSALSRGEIDYLFTNPGHLHRLAEDNRLFPMVGLRSDREGAPVTGNRFGAVIFVRADNPDIETLADLKGRRFAAIAPDAFGGFELAAATLVRNGVNPWRDLESVSFLGFPHDAVIEAVMSGKADAGTVRTGMLEAAVMAGKVEAYQLRILNPLRVPGFEPALSTELLPEWTLCATANVPEPERRAVTVAMLAFEDDHPAVVAGGYGGWTTVSPDAPVRHLLETVDAARPGDASPAIALSGLMIAAAGAVPIGIAMLIYWRGRHAAHTPPEAAAAGPAEDTADVRLTPRELEILQLVGNGMTTKQIARDLGISPKTVEFHRGHLMRKYEASNMAELVRKAGPALAG
ncbi:PhnD/SsuA/transferrin family substrate-binding protein [Oricola sp.]|uniref:PhnD/SsuA/transferrin family substrate-binding protein n=1 Tax=Oricola sp. TaxID=1979950 RepID=UPI0025E60EFC|nr:PhnD/SsuA/transferrin family substrate-binding protein [Oricola sp.]MCI5078504.1 PhnD/SsuA/transferrin family substrate-binding protein [Oricola sp.]